MIRRLFEAELKREFSHFPVVTLLGPRQCGKTTLAKTVFPEYAYVDLEKPSDFSRVSEDVESFLKEIRGPVIFDEAQRFPGLFPVLRGIVDEHRPKNGLFILLGSASPSLVRDISESLAGRTTFLDLTPFLWPEISGKTNLTLKDLWFRGGFPSALLGEDDAARQDWYDAYLRAFTERDLNALGIETDPLMMRRLLQMIAHGNGGLWNASQYGASLGISYNTVNRYADILERTFFVRSLLPWSSNKGKRLVKRPKLYFRDCGLLHHLLGIRDPAVLDAHPSRGASWETFALEQLMATCRLEFRPEGFFFYRSAIGEEVDLMIETGGRLIPIEIKLHSAPSNDHLKGMRKVMKDLGLRTGWVVYPGEEEYSIGHGVRAIGLSAVLLSPQKILG
jgi:predicted AAA+ superfamily ATPase